MGPTHAPPHISRPTLFGSNAKHGSEIWPILSAESSLFGNSYEVDPLNPNPTWKDFLGDYLIHYGNMACVENYLLADYNTDIPSWGDNNFNGFQWFATGFMIPNNIMKMNSDEIKSDEKDISSFNNVQIYNMYGKMIFDGELPKFNMNYANYATGAYVVKAIIDNQNVTTKIVIIK